MKLPHGPCPLDRPRQSVISAGLALLSVTAAASAALPVFLGPGDDPAYGSPRAPTNRRQVSNGGIAIGSTSPTAGGTYAWHFSPTTPVVATRLGTTYSPFQSVSINAGGRALMISYYSTAGFGNGTYLPLGGRYSAGVAGAGFEALPVHVSTNGELARTIPTDMNNLGVVIGTSSDRNGSKIALWPAAPHTQPQLLATDSFDVPSGTSYQPLALNDAGQIVGQAGGRAVRWNVNRSVVALPLPGGVNTSHAVGIAASGLSIGYVDRFSSTDLGPRAVRWSADASSVTELGTLGQTQEFRAYAAPRAINDAGTIVGISKRYAADGRDLGTRAARWAADAIDPVELEGLGLGSQGTTENDATHINALGTVAGRATRWISGINYGDRAVLWLPGSTQALDLNTLHGLGNNGTMTNVYGISDTGYVTGVGFFTQGSLSASRLWTMLVPAAGTYGRGDANFDTRVDFDDLLLLAKNYGRPSNGSTNVADFELDGDTDFDDLLTLARNYGYATMTALAAATNDDFAADFALAQSLVPEPATVASVIAMATGVMRRRRPA